MEKYRAPTKQRKSIRAKVPWHKKPNEAKRSFFDLSTDLENAFRDFRAAYCDDSKRFADDNDLRHLVRNDFNRLDLEDDQEITSLLASQIDITNIK